MRVSYLTRRIQHHEDNLPESFLITADDERCPRGGEHALGSSAINWDPINPNLVARNDRLWLLSTFVYSEIVLYGFGISIWSGEFARDSGSLVTLEQGSKRNDLSTSLNFRAFRTRQQI